MGADPLLVQTDAGATLSWKGVDFYPRTDPVDYARRKARVFSPQPRSLVFVPSVGLGHGLDELLRACPPDCAVLCVEAFQEVMGIALRRGIQNDPRLRVVRTDDPEAAVQVLRSLGTGRFRRVVEVPLCAGYRLAPGTYAAIRRRLEQELVSFWQNRLTMIALGMTRRALGFALPAGKSTASGRRTVACCMSVTMHGVNIAARLEGIAEPGAICLSEQVY